MRRFKDSKPLFLPVSQFVADTFPVRVRPLRFGWGRGAQAGCSWVVLNRRLNRPATGKASATQLTPFQNQLFLRNFSMTRQNNIKWS